jgi:hypothetical protein
MMRSRGTTAPEVDITSTTRQNICQIRGILFRKMARAVIKQLCGEEQATEDRVRHLAKDNEFQELVGEAWLLHCREKRT